MRRLQFQRPGDEHIKANHHPRDACAKPHNATQREQRNEKFKPPRRNLHAARYGERPLLYFPIQLAAELEDPLLLEALLLFEGSHLFELLVVVIN